MGRHTKAEFARICGLTTGNLSNYISRKKVIVEDDFIDDSNLINAEFLKKRKEYLQGKKDLLKPGATGLPGDESPIDNVSDTAEEDEDSETYSGSLTTKKMKVEIAKKTRETAILKLREQKIKGEIVPVAMMRNLFSMHTQSIITAQKDGIEELLINLSVEARLSGEQLARLRRKMVQILNDGVDKAIVITQRNIRSVTEEFSIKKDVGEHG